jgi:hypothetical protein
MRRGVLLLALAGVVAVAVAGAAFVGAVGPSGATASSHREAPLIADDPAVDNTDLYAFVSPDKPDTVTIIANFIPFEDPAGGPNYYRFDPTARYEIHIDNDGDARDDVTYRFRFKTTVSNPNTFLYNTGPITFQDDPDLNVKQTYSIEKITRIGSTQTVSNQVLRVAPANIGPRSNPVYDTTMGITNLGGNRLVFAGPRDDPFFVDLGSIFDLGGLRPFNPFHAIKPPANAEAGVDGVLNYNTHTIALQVPKTDLLEAPAANGTIGIYASASRQKVRVLGGDGTVDSNGPWVQVSRLGNPLINEVIIPIGQKDLWNASDPEDDSQFLARYRSPELATLINVLYGPPVMDTLTDNRDDLVAVLLTGVPSLNFTGDVKADLLRLNTAIPPAANPDPMGVLAGDFQGYPNGRRLADDVTDIELRAIACGYGPILNGALGLCNLPPNDTVSDGVQSNADNAFLSTFPYAAIPNRGYEHTGHK